MRILKIDNRKDKKVLRKKARPFKFESMSKEEIHKLVRDMKETMRLADGVGLAANQVGFNSSFFVAEVDEKFYAIFNPEIVERSEEKFLLEEGCLSVSNEVIAIEHSETVVLKGFDKNGKRIKIKARDLLAAVFEHEMDHLNGKLIIDHIKK